MVASPIYREIFESQIGNDMNSEATAEQKVIIAVTLRKPGSRTI
jgi:hypothetical protein